MPADAAPARHLFICGLHRSGTSPLHRLLRAQAGVSGFEDTPATEDEGQHLQSAIPPALAFGGPGRFAFDPRSSLDESDATEEVAERLRGDWAGHWDGSASWLLEKSPPNIVRSRFLQSVYPDATFVFVLRHPVAVSLATWKWAKELHLETLIDHWLLAHEQARADAPSLDRATWLTFEQFVADPQQAVRRCLDLGDDDTVVVPEPIRQGANEKYFDRWRQLTTNRLSNRWMSRTIGRLESRVRRFGYSLTDLDASPSAAELAGD